MPDFTNVFVSVIISWNLVLAAGIISWN